MVLLQDHRLNRGQIGHYSGPSYPESPAVAVPDAGLSLWHGNLRKRGVEERTWVRGHNRQGSTAGQRAERGALWGALSSRRRRLGGAGRPADA